MDELHEYGKPVVPRSGYIVEFNALWYNVLRFTAAMEMESGNEERANELDVLAEKCKVSFVETFLNEYGYLYDYVDGRMVDWSVRPNMVFAVALDYSPLDQKQRRGVLDVCTRELLTPRDCVRFLQRVVDIIRCILAHRVNATLPIIKEQLGHGWVASILRPA